MEKLVIAGREFTSRLFLGTGKFDSNDLMARSIMASGTEMVTVAMKRIELEDKEDDMLKHIVRPEIQLLPNTSGSGMPKKPCSPPRWHARHSVRIG